MKKFNPDEYDDVQSRIQKFLKDHPDGRIITKNLTPQDPERALFIAMVYLNKEDQEKKLVKATGYAEEWRVKTKSVSSTGKEYESVNYTSWTENSECMPLDTQALTKDGWKFYYQLKIGDDILTYNVKTGNLEWNELEQVGVFRRQPVIELYNRGVNYVCTPDHRWVYNGKLTPTNKFGSTGAITLTPPSYQAKDLINDGARLGWLFCDGHITTTANGLPSTAYIMQTDKKGNIEVLNELFGDTSVAVKKYKENWKQCYKWYIEADVVRDILGKFGVAASSDLVRAVVNMDLEDVAGFYDSAMRADGYHGAIAKTNRHIIDAIQVAALRLGIRTGKVVASMKENATKPLYTLPIYSSKHLYVETLKKRNLPPVDVWSPTIENGTWVARQNGQVFVTGNTSAIGRALANMGYSGSKRPSREEMEKVERVTSSQSPTKATPKQISVLKPLIKAGFIKKNELTKFVKEKDGRKYISFDNMSVKEASELITLGFQRKDEKEGKASEKKEVKKPSAIDELLAM